MASATNRAVKTAHVSTPTYGPEHAEKLRAIAEQLFTPMRPSTIPSDIFDLDYERRKRLAAGILELAEDIEAAPGPVEVSLVAPSDCKYTVDESRDLLYLFRVALT
jgi:hypothetical protein